MSQRSGPVNQPAEKILKDLRRIMRRNFSALRKDPLNWRRLRQVSAMKAHKGIGMEGGLARWYDKTTRRDMPEFVGLAARIAAIVPASAVVLEVAPGPGFLSIELAKRGLAVRAVDVGKTFVEIARRNAAV